MTNIEPELNITYARLLKLTEDFLRLLVIRHVGFPPESHDKGLRNGVILYWYKLALKTGASDKQCLEDYNQLRILACLSVDTQESPADDH